MDNPLYLYNSLSRKKEIFTPLSAPQVGLYTCGPTVYDYQHIGNLRAYITWDILKKVLQSHGYEVRHIMNVTDVGHLTDDADTGEDKMEIARKRERMNAWELADKYFAVFKQDSDLLHITPPTEYVKATELIPEQIAFVKQLDDKGFLYRTSDGMYFDTSKVKDYGKVGTLAVAGQRAGARVSVSAEKKNPTDFAVWKFSPSDSKREMEWDSPWGIGFPGWHLECSVIAMEKLGPQFDIHTGGIDHRTVHHPNEMAQSEAVTGTLQARYWLHNNFVNYQDKKMAKSAGTYVRLEDIVAGGVSAVAYRFFVMQTQYRKEIAYSWEALKAAHQGLKNVYLDMSFLPMGAGRCVSYEKKFNAALADDLNTPKALDVMQKLLKSSEENCAKLQSLFVMDEVLSLGLKDEWQRRQNLPIRARTLLAERAVARADNDWARADAIRQELTNLHVAVKDTKAGQQAVLAD